MQGECHQARIRVLTSLLCGVSRFNTPDPLRSSLRNGSNHLCPAKPPDSSRPDPGSDEEKEATALRRPARMPQTSRRLLAPFPKSAGGRWSRSELGQSLG